MLTMAIEAVPNLRSYIRQIECLVHCILGDFGVGRRNHVAAIISTPKV